MSKEITADELLEYLNQEDMWEEGPFTVKGLRNIVRIMKQEREDAERLGHE